MIVGIIQWRIRPVHTDTCMHAAPRFYINPLENTVKNTLCRIRIYDDLVQMASLCVLYNSESDLYIQTHACIRHLDFT